MTIRNIVAAALFATALTACNANQTKIIADVQAAAVLACAFEPTAATIAALLSGGVSAPASSIAAQICGVVTSPKKSVMDAPWTYPGTNVVIHGEFIAKDPPK